MTLQELNDTVQYLLIGIGMFVIAIYLVMVVTYYNTPVFVAILVYVGIYSLIRKALTHDLLQPPSHTS